MKTKLHELIKNAEVGNIYKVIEGRNPHTNKKETLYVTVIDKKNDGFYWYYGIGENVKSERVIHSNSFVWGVEDYSLVGKIEFKTKELNGYSWIETGIEEIDLQMSALGQKYRAFYSMSTPSLKRTFSRRENENYHKENQIMVNSFLNFVINGGSPSDFKVPRKKKQL